MEPPSKRSKAGIEPSEVEKDGSHPDLQQLDVGRIMKSEEAELFRTLEKRRDKIPEEVYSTGGEFLPAVVEVSACPRPEMNQKFHLVSTDTVRLVRPLQAPASKMNSFMYLAAFALHEQEGHPGALPYLWHDTDHDQWKLAVLGGSSKSSLYKCSLKFGGDFPYELEEWKSMGYSGDHTDHDPSAMRISVVDEDSRLLPRAAHPDHIPRRFLPRKRVHYPAVVPGFQLAVEDARRFFQDGFIVKKAEELGTAEACAAARRATNLLLKQLLQSGKEDASRGLCDYAISETHSAWYDCCRPLQDSPQLWSFISALFGTSVDPPIRLQVALNFPSGNYSEEFQGRDDKCRSYHIDGKGTIPNEFAVLVGVALTGVPLGVKSWGGLMVFPGSHADVDLHKRYVQFGDAERPEIGSEGIQMELSPGDVVIAHSLLAHRRALNWSPDIRHMLYFRLRPKCPEEEWQQWTLGGDPFIVFKGLKKVLQEHGPPSAA